MSSASLRLGNDFSLPRFKFALVSLESIRVIDPVPFLFVLSRFIQMPIPLLKVVADSVRYVILGGAFRRNFDVLFNTVQGSSRMSKIKMRCITCGKWFQSANAKEVTCPDCTQKARKEKLASKNTPPPGTKPVGNGPGTTNRPAAPPPKPKPAKSTTSHWFDSLDDVKVGQPEQPPARPKLPTSPASRETFGGSGGYRSPTGPGTHRDDRGPGGYREGERGSGGYQGGRGPGAYREGGRTPGSYREGGRTPGSYRDGERGPGGYRSGGGVSTFGQRPRQPSEGGFGRGPHERGP